MEFTRTTQFPQEVENDGSRVQIKPIGGPVRVEDLGTPSAQSTVSGDMEPPKNTTFSADTSLPPSPEEPDASPEAIDWDNLSEDEKINKLSESLRKADIPEEVIAKLSEAIIEAKSELDDESGDTQQDIVKPEKNKQPMSKKQVAGAFLLFVVGAAIDKNGTAHMLEKIMSSYVQKNYLSPFMVKLGFDPELVESLHNRRYDLGRNMFQWERPKLLAFLSDLSKADAFDLLDNLDEDERTELLSTGSLGEARSVLSKSEVKKYLLNRLSSAQKQKLHIADPS